MAKAPRPDELEVEPYTVEEVQALLRAASKDRTDYHAWKRLLAAAGLRMVACATPDTLPRRCC